MRLYTRDPYMRLPDWLRCVFLCGHCNGLGFITISGGDTWQEDAQCPACRGHGAGLGSFLPRLRWRSTLLRENNRLAREARKRAKGGAP